MTETTQRLLSAGLLALILHATALSLQLHQGQVTLSTPLAVQRIAVSLGVREVAREQPPTVKQIQQLPKKKAIVLPIKKLDKIHQQAPEKKQTVLPKSTPRPVGHKTEPKKPQQHQPEHQRTSSPPKEQSMIKSHATAQVIHKATPLYQVNPPPKYPRLAQRRGLEGVVLVEALINISGKVADIKIFTSSGHPVLDRAALKAVHNWHFIPGTVGGNRQEMWVKVPVRFQLH